jgi:rfaE bifunctional protein nucleotidyltransferase chain/domain
MQSGIKKAGKKTVLVGGCFDLLHYGHYTFLKKAKNCGDYLIVAVESDEFILKHKKRNSVHSQRERAEILSELKCVDEVIQMPYLSSDSEYEQFVKKIKPDIIAVTQGDPQIKNKRKQVAQVGGELKIVTPLLADFSSQKIIDSLL